MWKSNIIFIKPSINVMRGYYEEILFWIKAGIESVPPISPDLRFGSALLWKRYCFTERQFLSLSLCGLSVFGSLPSLATPLSAHRLAWLTPGVPQNRQAASAPGSVCPAAEGLILRAKGEMRFRGTPGKAAWHSVRMSRHGRGAGRARAERIPTVEAHRRMPP